MIKTLMARHKARAKAKRLEKYRLRLGLIAGHLHDMQQCPKMLSQFWHHLEVADLADITPKQRIGVLLRVTSTNLVELITFIEEFNHLMAEQADNALEQKCQNTFTQISAVVLDHYLSDDHQYGIDVIKCLTTLRGHLLSHVHLLDTFENQYYQRLAHGFYIELNRVTVQLVQLLTGKEIIAIERTL